MAAEREDTKRFELFTEGNYEFTVEDKPEKFRTESGKSTYRKWKLVTMIDGELKKFTTVIFPWESKDLLIALGGQPIPEDPEVIEIDYDLVEGKKFLADVIHEKDNNGVLRAKLRNATETIPF